MLKKGFFYFGLISIVAFMSSGFKNAKFEKYDWFHIDSNKINNYSLPSLENKDYINRKVPFTGNFFIGYKIRESWLLNRKSYIEKSIL